MGILIFEKNKVDIDFANVTITATDLVAYSNGQGLVDRLRNRRNDSGWATTSSTDAAGTTLEIEMGDAFDVTDILLIGHNFKAYTIEYWNGSTWAAFPTAISVAANTSTTNHHTFTEFAVSKFRIVISGTQVADQDKFLKQLIITKRIGQFTGQPYVKKPRHDRGRKAKKMLSGRVNVTRALGAFSCSLVFPPSKSATDLAIVERIFDSIAGVLVWLSGGDTAGFPVQVPGFRTEDIYLMACVNDLETEWRDGRFQYGQTPELQLVESRT